MSFWDKYDMTTHPLTDRHVALMAKIGIGVFRNHETGECYVSRRSWETCGQLMQEAVRKLVLGPPADDERITKLQEVVTADASEATHE